MRYTKFITPIIFLIVLTMLGACAPQGAEVTATPSAVQSPQVTPSVSPVEPEAPASPQPEESSPQPSPDPVAELLATMTTEEKVGQLLVAGFEGTTLSQEVTTLIEDYRVGGVILYGRNISDADQLWELVNGIKALNGENIPLFLSTDQEGGLVERMPSEVTKVPSAWQVGTVAEDLRQEAGTQLGTALGMQCAAFGFNTNYAPTLDIWSNPQNTVIGRRAFGDDPQQVMELGIPTALGMLDQGVIPVVKHFPGHGDTLADSHTALPVVHKTVDELLDFEFAPFVQAIGGETPMPGVMVVHVLLTQVDETYPSSLSPAVVDGLLRRELGFDGVVFTDDLTMGAVVQGRDIGEATVLAIEAGVDVALVCHVSTNVAAAHQALMEAVESGRISSERLDESVSRILALKLSQGLTNDPTPALDLTEVNAYTANLWKLLP